MKVISGARWRVDVSSVEFRVSRSGPSRVCFGGGGGIGTYDSIMLRSKLKFYSRFTSFSFTNFSFFKRQRLSVERFWLFDDLIGSTVCAFYSHIMVIN